MQTQDHQNQSSENDTTNPSSTSKASQQQSDPQLTELKGFVDPKVDLEPTLEDGTKAPDKAPAEHAENEQKNND